ncbi:2OG-Fe(II) oxygenase [Streptomyces mobaraensis NBRC 13819 = DSM 40847]|uniref:2OG-Fe(II) oxygenase n=1 Tax=Streptomyces mobaraensis TaxID=35621 RepID=UPI000996362A|nr:2OG-Fe(II) oxygenase [Streptomyces mobaraensis]QTT76393.1 2OG-Fe(II) oxygenase [Streptomyces mobaraensis NBRC 13819 = DSM 40847]
MQVSHKGSRFVVLDEILDPASESAMWAWFQTQSFGISVPGNWGRRPFDGVGAYASPSLVIDASAPPAELLGRTLLKAAQLAQDVVGVPGKDWRAVSRTCWTYPAGAQLSWHNDSAGDQTGAYVWYVHPQWGASWGGELLIVDEPASQLVTRAIESGLVRPGETESPLASEAESKVLFSALDPVCVQARPNRMVLLMRDTFHTVRRVDTSAGDRSRCSVAGFFLTMDGASQVANEEQQSRSTTGTAGLSSQLAAHQRAEGRPVQRG